MYIFLFYRLKIRFDGWPENHAYWVDDDSPDIHPMGWCMKTGHPLEPPLSKNFLNIFIPLVFLYSYSKYILLPPIAPDNLNDRPECGTYGCKGIGHVKGPKYATHNSASGCPYSPQNLHKVRQLADRLNLKHETCDFEDDVQDRPKLEKADKIKMEKSEKLEKPLFSEERLMKTEKDIKQEDGDFSDKNDKSENSEK